MPSTSSPAPPTGAALATSAVPVIDISPYLEGTPEGRAAVAAAVGRACEDIGFLVITGHGVAQASIDAMYETSRRFFERPMDEKMAVVSPGGNPFEGYSPNPGKASGDTPVLREFFHSSRYDTTEEAVANGYPADVASSLPVNLWPEAPDDFEAVWKHYFAEMEALARRMLHIFATALDLPEDWFDDKVDRHLGNLAANYYLAQPVEPQPGQLRSQAHVDFSTLTILYRDDAPGGLQVHQRGAGWVDVPDIEGSYVVNLGDMMARWTNDKWVATPHRVVNPPRELAMTTRISVPFFHLPNHEAVIESIPTCVTATQPERYVPIDAGEWIAARRQGRSANFGRSPRSRPPTRCLMTDW